MSSWERPWEQRLYNKRKAAHECVNCGKQDDRTRKGLTLCEHCAAVNSANYARVDKAKKRAARKKAYIKKVQNHICPRCNKPLSEDYFFTVCESCRERYKEYCRKKKTAGAATPNGQ